MQYKYGNFGGRCRPAGCWRRRSECLQPQPDANRVGIRVPIVGYLPEMSETSSSWIDREGHPFRSSEAKLNIHRLLERLDDLLAHFLGVAEQHHRVVAKEQLILDAGIARSHGALDEKHGLGALDLKDRHAIDR